MPLGNKNFTKILGNASISTGVFFSNMTNASQTEISGPLLVGQVILALGIVFLEYYGLMQGLY